MKKIVIVEDHLETAEMIKMVLKPRGYELYHTPDGERAIELIRQNQPDIILLDVMLPGMDGYSIQSALLEDPELKNIPILIMTSKPKTEEIFQTATNVLGFIEKPFVVKDFVKMVEDILEQKK